MSKYVHLSGANAELISAPNISAYGITGDFALIARARPPDWSSDPIQFLANTWYTSGGAGSGRGYSSFISTSGAMTIEWFDGTSNQSEFSTVTLPTFMTDFVPGWIAAELIVDNGASGYDVKFWYSLDDTDDEDQVTWIQLGTTVVGGAITQVDPTTNPLAAFGSYNATVNNFLGGCLRSIVKDGGLNGTVVFDADFTKLTVADIEAGSFIEDSSNAATVSIEGDEWTYVPLISSGLLSTFEGVWMAGDGNKGFSPKWADRTGNDHHAQNGSAPGADTNDLLFKARDGFQYVNLPDVDGNYINDSTPPASADIAVEDVATIAAWVRSINGNTFDRVFVTRTNNNGLILQTASATTRQPAFSLNDGVASIAIDADAQIANGEWHHLVAVVDHTTAVDEMLLYVDGSPVSANPVDISTLGDVDAQALRIGWIDAASTADIDYVTIEFYKDLASADQISAAFAGGIGTLLPLSSPVTVVNFADIGLASQPFASITDPQGNVYTVNRSATGYVSTLITEDIWLASTDDEMMVLDHPALDFAAAEGFTMWALVVMNDATVGADVRFMSKRDFGATLGWELRVLTADGPQPSFYISDGAVNITDLGAAISDNVPTFVGGVRNIGDDDIEAFVDGVGSGSPTADTTTTTLAGIADLHFATQPDSSLYFLDGGLIALGVSRNELSDEEMLQLANELLGLGGGQMMMMGVG